MVKGSSFHAPHSLNSPYITSLILYCKFPPSSVGLRGLIWRRKRAQETSLELFERVMLSKAFFLMVTKNCGRISLIFTSAQPSLTLHLKHVSTSILDDSVSTINHDTGTLNVACLPATQKQRRISNLLRHGQPLHRNYHRNHLHHHVSLPGHLVHHRRIY